MANIVETKFGPRTVYINDIDVSEDKENFYLMKNVGDSNSITLYCRSNKGDVYYGKVKLDKEKAIKLKNALEESIKDLGD